MTVRVHIDLDLLPDPNPDPPLVDDALWQDHSDKRPSVDAALAADWYLRDLLLCVRTGVMTVDAAHAAWSRSGRTVGV